MEETIEKIKEKISPILRRFDVRRAAIFGSYVRDEMEKGSDIDILVEFEGEKSLLDLVGLKLELEEVLGVKVDVVEYSTIHPLLKDRILREQVTVL